MKIGISNSLSILGPGGTNVPGPWTQFEVPNKIDTHVARGVGTNTYSTGGSKRYVPNHLGVLVTVPVDVPAFPGLRLTYDVTEGSTRGAELNSGGLTTGVAYEITACSSVNFVSVGAADNNVGTVFIATGTVTLDATNKVKVATPVWKDTTSAVDSTPITPNAWYKGGVLSEPVGTNLINNSAAPATQSRAVTAQPYTLSTYGIGTVTLSGAATGSVTGTTATDIKTLTFTPSAGTLTLTLSGGTVTVMQVETGSVNTSFMIGTGSTTGRPATSDAYQTSGNLPANNFTLYGEFTTPPVLQSSSNMFVVGTDGNNFLQIGQFGGSFLVRKAVAGTPYSISSASIAANTRYKIALKVNVDWTAAFFINGVASGTNATTFVVPFGTSFYLGSDNLGTGQFNGWLQSWRVYNTALSDAQCAAMTA